MESFQEDLIEFSTHSRDGLFPMYPPRIAKAKELQQVVATVLEIEMDNHSPSRKIGMDGEIGMLHLLLYRN